MNTKSMIFLIQLLLIPLYAQNYSLDFDGSMDLVEISNGSALVANTSELTVSGWVFPRNYDSGWPDFDGYFGVRNETDADYYILQLYGFQLECRMRNSAGEMFTITTEVGAVQPEVWQHLALTYDGSELTVYVDGVSAGSTPASGQITNTSEVFRIGSLSYFGTAFDLDGLADDVRVWSRTLTAEEIQEYMDQDVIGEAGLVGYWKFNEGEGYTANNSVSGTYHGALLGDPQWSENSSPVDDLFCGLPGDVNFDDLIDVTDIVTIVVAIIDLNTETVICGDMNGDDAIDVMDIVLIVNLILGEV